MTTTLRALALAVAALAGTAQAQSSVTIYGIVDLGVQWEDGLTDNTSRVVSGGRSASRLGFRGTEDLGGGLSAIFTLESGINADSGSIGQGGRFFGRQSSVGLTGGWGTLAAGRFGTFGSGTGTFDMFGPIDPFVTSWGTAGLGSSMSSANALRVANAVLYRTPDMAGFQAGVLHSLQAIADAEVSPQGANVYLTGLGLRYAAGPFYAAITYDQANNPAGGPDEKHLQIGASYDLKVVKLHGAYAREKDLFSADLNTSGTTNGADAKAWMLGLTVPLGGGNLVTSYQRRDGEQLGGEKRDLRVWALGYEYFLSKRSSLYGVVADEDGRNTLATMPAFNRRQYTAGVLHKF
jgi:GBP family porin